MSIQNEELETHDIYLAAFLNIAGCTMERRRRQGPRVFFIFTNKGGDIQELRESFYSGKAQVKAYAYSKEIVAFKELTQNL